MLTIRTNPYQLITDSMQQGFEKALEDWYAWEAERYAIPDMARILQENKNIYFDEMIAAVVHSIIETEGKDGDEGTFDRMIEEVYGDHEHLTDCLGDAYTFLMNNRYFHAHTVDSECFSVWGRKYWEGQTHIDHCPLQEVW